MSYFDLFNTIMLDKKIDPSFKLNDPNDINAMSAGAPLIHFAITKGNLENCKYLFENGADLNIQYYYENALSTPGETAAFEINDDVLLFILENGATLHSTYYDWLLQRYFLTMFYHETYLKIFKIAAKFATTFELKVNLGELNLAIGDLRYWDISKFFESLKFVTVKTCVNMNIIKWLVELINSVKTIKIVSLVDCDLQDQMVIGFCNDIVATNNLQRIDLRKNASLSSKIIDILLEWIPKHRNVVDIFMDGSDLFKGGDKLRDGIINLRKSRERVKLMILYDRTFNENSIFKIYFPLDILIEIFYYIGFSKRRTMVKKRKIENF